MGAEGSKEGQQPAEAAKAAPAESKPAEAAKAAAPAPEKKPEAAAPAPSSPEKKPETPAKPEAEKKEKAEAAPKAPSSPEKKPEAAPKAPSSPEKKAEKSPKAEGEKKEKAKTKGKGKDGKASVPVSGPTAAGSGYRLNVKNLAKETTEAELRTMFEPYGKVSLAQLKKDEKGESRGFGFVVLASEEEGKKAIAEMNDKEVAGNKLAVGAAERRDGGVGDKGKGKGKGKGKDNLQMQQQQMYMQQMAYMQQYAYMSQYYAMAQQQQVLSSEYEGSIKSVSERHGFIVCAQTFTQYQRDVYVDKATLPEGATRGTRVKFTIEMNEKGHPKAKTCKLAA